MDQVAKLLSETLIKINRNNNDREATIADQLVNEYERLRNEVEANEEAVKKNLKQFYEQCVSGTDPFATISPTEALMISIILYSDETDRLIFANNILKKEPKDRLTIHNLNILKKLNMYEENYKKTLSMDMPLFPGQDEFVKANYSLLRQVRGGEVQRKVTPEKIFGGEAYLPVINTENGPQAVATPVEEAFKDVNAQLQKLTLRNEQLTRELQDSKEETRKLIAQIQQQHQQPQTYHSQQYPQPQQYQQFQQVQPCQQFQPPYYEQPQQFQQFHQQRRRWPKRKNFYDYNTKNAFQSQGSGTRNF